MGKPLRYFLFVLISLSSSWACLAMPVSEDEVELDALLQSYFKILQEMYPPGQMEQTDSKLTVLISRKKTKHLWALKDRDIKMPDLLSALAFMLYRPSGWEVSKYSVAGDYAKANVSLTIGDPTRKRLRERVGKDLSRRVSYSFVRVSDNWRIVNFNDLDGEKSREQSAALQEKEKRRVDTSLVQGKSSVDVVELYLLTVQKLVANKEAAQMRQAMLETTSLWAKNRSVSKERSQNVSQLFLKAPFSWAVLERMDTNEGEKVSVAITSEGKSIGGSFLNNFKISFSLVRQDDNWLISGAKILR